MTNLERSTHFTNVITITMLYTVVLLAILRVSAGQDVYMYVSSASADNKTQATLNCNYSISGSGYTLFNVQWSFGEDADTAVTIANFFSGATSPAFANGYAEPAYKITRTDELSQFVIAESIYDTDKGTYWCRVEYTQGLERPTERQSGILDIDVLPSRPTLSNGTHDFQEGSTIKLLAGDVVQFICMVADVKPQANFKWMYDSDELEGKPEHVLNDNGLYNSISRVNLTAKFELTSLQCTAVNKPGYVGESASVTLDVENPCENAGSGSTFCQNEGTCSIDNGVPKCTCKEGFSGNNCEMKPIGLSTGAKIGIGVGCACGCVIAVGCGIAIYKHNKTTEVTPEGQSKEGQSKKGQSKKGKKKDADGKTPENV